MGGAPGGGEDVSRLRAQLGSDYLAGIFRTPDELASQVAAAVSAQGLTRHMVDRVLGETSVASQDMDPFAQGIEVNESSLGSIKRMIQSSGAVRALVLPIDEGQRWWSTRLFLLASLLQSLTAVRQIVFCDALGRFAGMTSPAAIVDGLGFAFPKLDEFRRKLREEAQSLDIERETNRQTEAWKTFVGPSPAEQNLKVGVRAPLLERWLGERWVGRCVRIDGNDLSKLASSNGCRVPAPWCRAITQRWRFLAGKLHVRRQARHQCLPSTRGANDHRVHHRGSLHPALCCVAPRFRSRCLLWVQAVLERARLAPRLLTRRCRR
jgi:hypothetical protein